MYTYSILMNSWGFQCSAKLQSSGNQGSNSRQKTTKLQVFSTQQPCSATFMQHRWIFFLIYAELVAFYHHYPCSRFIARVRFWEEWRHTNSVEGSCFLKGRGQDCLWENSGSTNKPWFSSLYQPLGEWRGYLFSEIVCIINPQFAGKDLTKPRRCVF